jgi:deoxyribodipyrimidine photolyase
VDALKGQLDGRLESQQPRFGVRNVRCDVMLLADDLVDEALHTGPQQDPYRRWHDFLERRVDDYAATRDRVDLDGTSRMSVHLKWGEIHPRTMLADLARHPSAGAALYGTQLARREFYADVPWRSPDSAREYLKPDFAAMEYDDPGVAGRAHRQTGPWHRSEIGIVGTLR